MAEPHMAGASLECAACGQTAIVPPADVAADESTPGDAKSLRKQWRQRRRRKLQEDEPSGLATATVAATALPTVADRRRMRRIDRPRPTIPPEVYQPDARRITAAKWLALILSGIAAVSLLPLLVTGNLNMATAPWWSRAVLLMAVVQYVYILWMLAAPDWSSVWVLMIVFAVAAACYGAATAIALATPLGRPVALGMTEIRDTAKGWCACMMLAMSLGTYLCGRLAARWRRTFENEMAVRRRMTGRPG